MSQALSFHQIYNKPFVGTLYFFLGKYTAHIILFCCVFCFAKLTQYRSREQFRIILFISLPTGRLMAPSTASIL
jgi:hypothetical protein